MTEHTCTIQQYKAIDGYNCLLLIKLTIINKCFVIFFCVVAIKPLMKTPLLLIINHIINTDIIIRFCLASCTYTKPTCKAEGIDWTLIN